MHPGTRVGVSYNVQIAVDTASRTVAEPIVETLNGLLD